MLLTVENLKTYFFTSSGVVKAVEGVSFAVEKGGRLGIVGESGSGKSITALSLLRLVPPPGRIVGGGIRLEGQDLLVLSEEEMREIRGGRIAMIFQEPSTALNPVYTIGQQIEEAIRLHQRGLSRREREALVLEMIARVRIPDPARISRSYPHEVSGGMKQRAMIAMALACRPALLIADEPTTALDVTVQAQILDLLRELQEELEMALILISHDIGVIAETVDHLLVMQGGQAVESAAVGDLLTSPKHPYSRKLLEIYERLGRC